MKKIFKSIFFLIVIVFCFFVTKKQFIYANTLTFEKKFKNIETAKIISSFFKKNIQDEIDFKSLNCTEINIENQNIKDIRGIGIFSKLKSINLKNNKIEYLPEDIYYLENLEYLNFSNNNIKELLNEKKELLNLYSSFLFNNNIFVFNNKEMNNLKFIEYIYIVNNNLFVNKNIINNNIFDLFKNIRNCFKNYSLFINENYNKKKILDYNNDVLNFKNSQYLYLFNNSLINYSKHSTCLNKLKVLDLSKNKIKKANIFLSNLINLEELKLNDNELNSMSFNFNNLSNLKIANFSNNNINELNKGIKKLFLLKKLDVSNNNLFKIPDEIENLTNLNSLNLEFNKIENLTNKICKLNKLEELRLGNNNIKELPDNIKNLINLKYLFLEKNKLIKLPNDINKLYNLLELSLSENKLFDDIYKIIDLPNLIFLNIKNQKIILDKKEFNDKIIIKFPIKLESLKNISIEPDFLNKELNIEENIIILKNIPKDLDNINLKFEKKLKFNNFETIYSANIIQPLNLVKNDLYNLNFDLNYYSNDLKKDSNYINIQRLKRNSKAKKIENPKRKGYNFLGWNTLKNGKGINWNFDKNEIFNQNIVLYAQWKKDEIFSRILENKQIKTNKNNYVQNYLNQKLKHIESNQKSMKSLNKNILYKNIKLQTKIDSNSFVLNFKTNGGNGIVPKPRIIKQGEIFSDSKNFFKEGYEFVGWNTSPGGKGIFWNPEETKMSKNDLVLYPYWKGIPHKLEFNFNLNNKKINEKDYEIEFKKQTIRTGELIYKLPILPENINLGYKFISWNKSPIGNGKTWDFEKDLMPNEDINLYAQWEAIPYNLSFDLNGGEYKNDISLISKLVKGNAKTQILKINEIPNGVLDPIREGYNFVGWNTARYGNGKTWDFEKDLMPNDNIILYAYWQGLSNNLIFDSNIDQEIIIEKQIVKTGEKAKAIKDPTREGYKFLGWNIKKDGRGKVWNFDNETMPNKDVTLYAQWEGLPYNVNFDLNNEEQLEINLEQYKEIIKTQKINTDELIKNIEGKKIKRIGYIFVGWNTEKDGSGINWDFEKNKMPNKDIVLYAQWKGNSHEVKFNLNDGTSKNNIKTKILGTDQKIIFNKFENPIKIGYIFVGWNTEKDGSGINWDFEKNKMPNKDIVLYAQWKGVPHTVKFFDVSDGKEQEIESKTVNTGELIDLEKINLYKEGYVLNGWRVSKDENIKFWNFEKDLMPNDDIILYAKWKGLPHKLKFDTNGGDAISLESQLIETNELAEKVENPIKEGYIFYEWIDENGNSWDFKKSRMPNCDLVLYAKWKGLPHKLKFDTNGGDAISLESQLIETNELAEKVANPIKEGYTFIGWNTLIDGKGIDWDFSKKRMPNKDVILYAKWKANLYNLNFDLNGGDKNYPEKQIIATDQKAYVVKEPEKEGYRFISWNTEKNGKGIIWDLKKNTMPSKDVILYAQWKGLSHKLKFDFNFKTLNEELSKEIIDSKIKEIFTGELTIKIDDPIREGYKFISWNTEKDGSGIDWNFEKDLFENKDIILYAKWQGLPKTVIFDFNGGYVGWLFTSKEESKIAIVGSLIEPIKNLPYRTEYIFDGWTLDREGKSKYWNFDKNLMINKDLKLYAQWKKK